MGFCSFSTLFCGMKGILRDDEIVFPSYLEYMLQSHYVTYFFKMLGCELKAFFISDNRNGKKAQVQQKPDRSITLTMSSRCGFENRLAL